MDEPLSLYEIRKRLDSKRQPGHASALLKLDGALRSLDPPKEHPYKLTDPDLAALRQKADYKSICRNGKSAHIQSKYCYRLVTWAKLENDISDITRSGRIAHSYAREDEVFRHIQGQHISKGGWIPLSDFIGGILIGRQGFTWWTSTELPTSATMCGAHQMGLLNKEIGTEVLILRCETDRLRIGNPKVPSVVDAFFSHIFCAMRESDNPRCGRAISLESPIALELGADEFVVGPIDIEACQLEIWPEDLFSSDHKVYFEDVYPLLKKYYRGLENE
jgi:hypothetical protein